MSARIGAMRHVKRWCKLLNAVACNWIIELEVQVHKFKGRPVPASTTVDNEILPFILPIRQQLTDLTMRPYPITERLITGNYMDAA
ncbi:hypothetical protein SADUNF_Sadunf06G0149300 [Salix dunnii]|uniref:Uncharacterized protein n=1 Tax=Salix dunnii TaxID=1413687 RepID=A0A835MXA8_9ROSI|nr:hypothetical protein SADUNF_Sadunf06G0149300 [Salix dunnii]